MEDKKIPSRVIVYSYFTRIHLLVVIGVTILIFIAMGSSQSRLLKTHTESTDWWVVNILFSVFIIMVVIDYINGLRYIKHPLKSVFYNPASHFVTIEGHSPFAGKWTRRKEPKFHYQIAGKIVMPLIVLLIWSVAVSVLYHFFSYFTYTYCS